MNNKQSGFIAYSFAGVAIMLVLLVIVNVIAGLVSLPRMDLTSERLYTLSDGTKRIFWEIWIPTSKFVFMRRGMTV